MIISSACLILYKKPFTVVIDAGHGGHDSGAVGKYSKEKNINLSVAKKLGNLINENYPDIKVVYTRTTDVFLTLQQRADIVNNNKADRTTRTFIPMRREVHQLTAETYVLGLHKTKTNLEVAMSENSVMMLEDDYQTKYQGFDPNSVDSYIIFEFMQDKYLDQSLKMASLIEEQFRDADRYSRGVRQAGFLGYFTNRLHRVCWWNWALSQMHPKKFLNTEERKKIN